MDADTLAENRRTGPADGLASWRDGPTREAVVAFVSQVCGGGGAPAVPVEQRVAVFDNDGTLWCEKPMPIQLDFILRRLVAMADEDTALRDRQPWKAAHERDHAWFDAAMQAHYAGDDRELKTFAAGVLAAHDGMSVEEFEERAEAFLRSASHPTLGRSYLGCTYRPMVELLDYLTAHGFTTYIVSGGGRDFMRPVSDELYRVPRERVIGSTVSLAYAGDDAGGRITHTPVLDYIDDGPQKPIRIWSRVGRRPLLAAGNSNGDSAMLDFSRHADTPFLQLLVLHDDEDREFAYTAGSESALEQAGRDGWTVVSMKDDWATVF